MHKAQRLAPLGFISSYIYHLLVLIGCFVLLFGTNSAFAAVQCDAGFESDNFSVDDYGRLAPVASPPNPKSNQNIEGLGTESYLIASNSWTLNGSLTPNGTNIYQSTAVAGSQIFQLSQDYANKTSFRTVSYTFKNKFTEGAQPLNKLSLSIYDIDTNIASISQNIRYFSWFDQVTINGFTSTGDLVTPTIQSKGVGITSTAPYRQNNVTSSVACSGLDDNCKVSVAFTDPVIRVDVVYGNNPNLNYSSNNDPSSQIINIKFDGYCYKPQPRLTYKKELSYPRKANTDQFTVQIKDNANNSVVTNGITTTTSTGTGSVVTNGTGTTGIFKVDPTKTYTLTETAAGSTNLVNYADSYICKRSDGTTVTTLNPKSLKLTYGDNWTCTITNSKPNYTFSGTVFNDNAGIAENNSIDLNTNTKSDISSTFTSNAKYFNGIFDQGESGISAAGLTVSLTDCNGTNITGTTAQVVGVSPLSQGQYKFTVPGNVISSLTPQKVCLVQNEPSGWEFSVDTTPNSREVALVDNIFDYKTESNGSRNLDFGEVKSNYSALVLIKSQYLYNCRIVNYNNIDAQPTPTNSPREGFSTSPATDAVPGECIAYRIQAFNRGHVDLSDIQISDTLQTTSVKSTFYTPQPNYGIPSNVYTYRSSNPYDVKIESNKFDLAKVPVSPSTATKASLFFSTKYGTTVNP